MKKPTMMRRRFIPDELVDISNDEVLYRSDSLLVTKWFAIRPRIDFASGISYAFLKEGYKLSKFFDQEGRFLYWYCDIIEIIYEQEYDKFTFNDLLLDIKVMADGCAKVLDADELADALEKGLISTEQAVIALKRLSKVLNMINEGKFPPNECNAF